MKPTGSVPGQSIVAAADVSFLPPMAEWYSGLVPYPILLAVQLLILGLQAAVIENREPRHGDAGSAAWPGTPG